MHITVIGAAGIDIFAKSKQEIVLGGSNPAEVKLRAGGVACNIASMLAKNGMDTCLITAVGNDPLGALLKNSCDNIGISTDAWIIKNNMCTCVNLETQESSGELCAGFYTAPVTESVRAGELTKHKSLIEDAGLLILDLNLTEKILAAAINLRGGGTVLVDGTSTSKVKRIEGLLDRVTVLKLNRWQAESLTGIPLDTKERVKHACYSLVSGGAGRVFITLGVAGVCASDDNSTIFVPAQPVAVKKTTGAGAAFITGLASRMNSDLRGQATQGIEYAARHLRTYAKR